MTLTVLRMLAIAWLLAILVYVPARQPTGQWGTAFQPTLLIEDTHQACWEFVYHAATRTLVLAEPDSCEEEGSR